MGNERHNPNGYIRKLAIGDRGGIDYWRLALNEMPSHSHNLHVWGHDAGWPKTGKTLKLTDNQKTLFKSENEKQRRDNNRNDNPVVITNTGGIDHAGNTPPFYTVVYLIKVNSVNAVNPVSS
jgi:microcystin-dependent protein